MPDKKIHIKPKSQGQATYKDKPDQSKRNLAKEFDELKKMIKNLKQQIQQMEAKEKFVDGMIDKEITIELMNGTQRKGILKQYAKFTIDIQEGESTVTYMKHGILNYRFD